MLPKLKANSVVNTRLGDIASHADVLGGSSRVPTQQGTRDEPLRTMGDMAHYSGKRLRIQVRFQK